MSALPSTHRVKAPQQIRVKFVSRGSTLRREIWLRQFPGNQPVWKNCHFSFDSETRDYDWLVVYDDLPSIAKERFSRRKETLACPREHTLLITGEPSSVKIYGTAFLAQFGHILTSHEPRIVTHPGAIFSQPALRWYYGLSADSVRTYDEMTARQPNAKARDLATVCSSKQQRHTLHHARYTFVQELKTLLPELDIYGHGVRPVADKAETLDPYRYHLAIENHVGRHHWTEKLSDAFLGLTLPFYYGCPNAADYFPPESFIPIDISDTAGSARRIQSAIANHEYEKRLPFIREARRRVLEHYNLFAVIADLVQNHSASATPGAPARRACILSRHEQLRRRPWLRLALTAEKLRARWNASRLRHNP
ncbi:MAG: glycosyltransferase family 10 [Verrucomicrobia bacterium]|nr:glycosyltransferase family 10 [Verrucomicrobiota bacterium]